tara:strand:- start:1058 stop:1282 length:225 start_codon:yes stop_codon:yes gene_type:complete
MSKDDFKKHMEEAKKQIKELKSQNSKLKDELESLWDMMDELKESDVKNWAHMMKQVEQDVLARSLMTTKKKVDC